MSLILRPFISGDEAAALAAVAEFQGSGLDFLPFGFTQGTTWSEWLARMDRYRKGIDLPENYVRSAFLAADVDGQLVGRVSIRFALNELLAVRGGHIGFAVIPAFRRKGYATSILHQAIEIAHNEGVRSILITCDDVNTGSARVIERCGGILESIRTDDDGIAFRRYWIRP